MKQKKFEFKKKYGQNFIQDSKVLDDIIELANLNSNDVVIEIGPGDGALTKRLAPLVKKVICFEIDTTLSDKLDLIENDNVFINYIDFMRVKIEEYIDSGVDSIKVVANLPYYITTPIINRLIDNYEIIDKIVIMVQKEVGDRICASNCSKDYNSFTLFLKYYYESSIGLFVGKDKFYPVPKVDSVVVAMNKDKTISSKIIDKEIYFKLIKDCFVHKRKNLRNNLLNYDNDLIMKVLSKYNFDLTTRAEQLPIEVFIELSNELSSINNN